jgi:hypothetical protein
MGFIDYCQVVVDGDVAGNGVAGTDCIPASRSARKDEFARAPLPVSCLKECWYPRPDRRVDSRVKDLRGSMAFRAHVPQQVAAQHRRQYTQ